MNDFIKKDNYLSFVILDALDKIKGDVELQNWAKDLTTPKQDGGAGLQVFKSVQ